MKSNQANYPIGTSKGQVPVNRRGFLRGALAATAAGSSLRVLRGLAQQSPAATATAEPAQFARKIKLGVIGCGGRGSWIAKLFKQHGGFELHALADYFADVVSSVGEGLGVDTARRLSTL